MKLSDMPKIRLIFHLYKNIGGKTELRALYSCMDELKRKYENLEIDYAFATISQNHSF